MGDENNPVKATVLEQMRRGIDLARAGNREGAEAEFSAVLAQRANHEEALVWKAAVVNDPAEAVRCLQQALRINPANQRARVGLEWAYKRQQSQAEVNDSTPSQTASKPGGAKQATAEPPSQPKNQPTFQPGVQTQSSPKSKEVASGETKNRVAPYKKRRLADNQVALPSLDLPPEALPWTRPNSPKSETGERKGGSAKAVAESDLLRAARPPIAFTISPRVLRAKRAGESVPVKLVPLRWPLALFGLALGLALLSFVFSSLATVLGIAAIAAAIAGAVLYNRAYL